MMLEILQMILRLIRAIMIHIANLDSNTMLEPSEQGIDNIY
jgi:hypothetical protein